MSSSAPAALFIMIKRWPRLYELRLSFFKAGDCIFQFGWVTAVMADQLQAVR